MDTKITTIIDGKTVDLEDAFEVFEDLFDEMDDVFSEMESVFARTDANINAKLDELKMRVVAKNPERYDFIADSRQEERRFEHELRSFHVNSAKRRQAARRTMLIMLTVAIFIFSIAITSIILSNTKETEKTTTIEQIQSTTSAGDSSL